MTTEDEIKKRLLQQRIYEEQALSQQQQIEDTLKAAMQQILEPKARERLTNLRVVKPDMALQLEAYLAQLYQAGQLKGRVTEEQLVMILKKLGEKRDFVIKRK